MQKLKLAEEEYPDKKQEVFKPSLLFWTEPVGNVQSLQSSAKPKNLMERWRKKAEAFWT